MRLGRGLLIAALCAVPMIASAGFIQHDTLIIHGTNNPVNLPEPGSLALLLAGVGSVVATWRRRR